MTMRYVRFIQFICRVNILIFFLLKNIGSTPNIQVQVYFKIEAHQVFTNINQVKQCSMQQAPSRREEPTRANTLHYASEGLICNVTYNRLESLSFEKCRIYIPCKKSVEVHPSQALRKCFMPTLIANVLKHTKIPTSVIIN